MIKQHRIFSNDTNVHYLNESNLCQSCLKRIHCLSDLILQYSRDKWQERRNEQHGILNEDRLEHYLM